MEKAVLDTNILLLLARDQNFRAFFGEKYAHANWQLLVPFATDAEISSLAFRRQWGTEKLHILQQTIAQFVIIDTVCASMKKAYTEIEAYTLCQHPTRPKPDGQTAHRMGKNDLWIAATTAVYAQRLITTDKDFLQLDGVFFAVDYIDIAHF
ncbi:MAG: PIN domain-containing protein [Bernardetiaceae bacterium]